MVQDLILLAFGLVLIIKGGDMFVAAAVRSAEFLRMPRVVIGGTLVSLTTTTPELVVSVMAGLEGEPGLAVGNAVGSVICNIGLVLGVTAALKQVDVPPKTLRFALLAMFGFGVALFLMTLDLSLSRAQGAVLLVGGLGYFVWDFARHWRGRKPDDVAEAVAISAELSESRWAWFETKAGTAVQFLVGAVIVVLGSKLLAPPSGEEGKAKGAMITLQSDGTYLRHAEVNFNHPSAYLSLDRTHRFLLSADYGKGFVDVYALDEAGVPGKRVTGLNEGRPTAHCIRTSPDNRFAYVSYVKENNTLYQYRFNANTGQMTALEPKNAGPPEGTGPRHMAFHPSKPVVYFSNEQQLGISAYHLEPSGQLKLRQVCDAVGKAEPRDGVSSSDLIVTPDGRLLFAGIRGHTRPFDWIRRYRVKENGDLELLGLTPADKVPWGLALSPTGQHLLVTAFDGATLTAFKISTAGDLAKAGSLTWEKQIFAIVTR